MNTLYDLSTNPTDAFAPISDLPGPGNVPMPAMLPPTNGNSPVPIETTITDRDAKQLAAPGQQFFRDMITPSVKHV